MSDVVLDLWEAVHSADPRMRVLEEDLADPFDEENDASVAIYVEYNKWSGCIVLCSGGSEIIVPAFLWERFAVEVTQATYLMMNEGLGDD